MIDAHQHFWMPSRGDYGWMEDNPAVAPIRRDILPADFEAASAGCGIEATVLVQAAPSVAETVWLLALAAATPRVARVVGWVDFTDVKAIDTLQAFKRDAAFAGVRPMIQDLPDVEWMHTTARSEVFDALIDLDLTFDALGFPVHIDAFARLFDRYPDMRSVIDHGLKPRIGAREFDDWADGIERLADATPVHMKLSGLLTEANDGDGIEALRPYVDHLLACFGAERLMWGSDWPVLELAGDYRGWLDMARTLIPQASHPAVFDRTARRFYRID